jgi:hypothetical protein
LTRNISTLSIGYLQLVGKFMNIENEFQNITCIYIDKNTDSYKSLDRNERFKILHACKSYDVWPAENNVHVWELSVVCPPASLSKRKIESVKVFATPVDVCDANIQGKKTEVSVRAVFSETEVYSDECISFHRELSSDEDPISDTENLGLSSSPSPSIHRELSSDEDPISDTESLGLSSYPTPSLWSEECPFKHDIPGLTRSLSPEASHEKIGDFCEGLVTSLKVGASEVLVVSDWGDGNKIEAQWF